MTVAKCSEGVRPTTIMPKKVKVHESEEHEHDVECEFPCNTEETFDGFATSSTLLCSVDNLGTSRQTHQMHALED